MEAQLSSFQGPDGLDGSVGSSSFLDCRAPADGRLGLAGVEIAKTSHGRSAEPGQEVFGLLSFPRRPRPSTSSGHSAHSAESHELAMTELQDGRYLQVDDDLLRGVPLRSTLKTLGWIWRLSPYDVDEKVSRQLWHQSRRVPQLDLFLSHTWRTPGTFKVLALMVRCGLHSALCLWFLAVVSTCALYSSFGHVMMPFVVRTYALSWDEKSPYGLWLMVAGFLGLLVGFGCSPYLPARGGSPLCFVDIACIHQTDLDLKQRGIRSIGGFLSHATELCVLWSPAYLSRRWGILQILDPYFGSLISKIMGF